MTKRRYVAIALTLASLLTFTSCGSKPASTTTSQQKQDLKAIEVISASNPGALPQSAKNRKDTLIVGTSEMEGKFLPIYSSTQYDSWVTYLTFDSLLKNDEKGNAVPDVAEKWEISPDGKTYTFHIKKGIKFINGDELTADDVAFTYTAIADPKYDGTRSDAVRNIEGYEEYNKGNAKSVSGIKVIDNYTIAFTEKRVKAPALLTDFGYGIMPKKVYNFPKGHIEQLKAKLLNPIGSGQYVFKGYKPGQEVDFEANANYFKGAPKINKIIMRKTSADTQIQLLKSGEVDVDKMTGKPESIDMIKSAGFVEIKLMPNNGYGYISFNTKLDMFKDKKVRQALTYGFNRKGFVQAYFKGYADVANVPISQLSWAYPDKSKLNTYEYNPDTANKLLDEAGWKMGNDGYRYKDGKKFTIRWITYTGSKYVDTLIPILKENWKKIGVEVVPELMDFGTLCTKVYDKQDFEMFNMSWSLNIDPDPSGIFSIKQAVPGGANAGAWTNPESEKLMEEGMTTVDQAKRKEIYQKWGVIVNEELPYIFLDQTKDLWAISSRVKNLEVSPFVEWPFNVYRAELVN